MPRIQIASCLAGMSVLCLLTTPLAAQEDYATRNGLTLGGGYGKYTGGNLDHTDLGPLLQAALRLGWKRHLDLSLGLRYGSFAATQLPDSSVTDAGGNVVPVTLQYYNQTTQVDFGLVYNWNPEARWTPIVFGGAGVSFWDVVDLTNKSTGLFASGDVPLGYKNDGTPEILSDGNVHLDFGLGVEFEVYRRTSVQVGGRIDCLLSQNKDNTGASAAFGSPAQVDANQFLSSAFVGLTYFFTERDSDRDGIANRADACPYEAEDRDGYQDFDGCPDADNDGDGVADAQDKCADQAEDKDGFQDEDGCPDTDDDADGVPDARDQCASTPQGVPVDSLGCPTVARIEAERVFAGVRFRTGSADLDPASFTSLDSIVTSLHAYPALEVEVQGHTSDVGDNAKTLQLSQSRAEAVVAYLVSRGIASRRLTPIGYGEEKPMLPNDSPANRGRNERIVVKPMEAAPLEPQPEKR